MQGVSKIDLSNAVWYLDTGAPSHMTGKKHLFYDLNEIFKGKVLFGDDSTINIEGKGTILLNTQIGSQITLKNVLYTPRLKANIVSLGRLDEQGYRILLHSRP